MKFLSFKSVVATGALSVAGLGLIGIGTHATFSVDPSANQVISTGTLLDLCGELRQHHPDDQRQ
jgi:hypothetical protein